MRKRLRKKIGAAGREHPHYGRLLAAARQGLSVPEMVAFIGEQKPLDEISGFRGIAEGAAAPFNDGGAVRIADHR